MINSTVSVWRVACFKLNMTVWDVLTEDGIKAYLKVNRLFLCLKENVLQETYYQVEFKLLSEQSEFSQSNRNAITTSLWLAKGYTKKQCVFVSFNLSAGTCCFSNYSSKGCWLSNIFIGILTLRFLTSSPTKKS